MEIFSFLPESSRSTHEKHVLSTLQEQSVDDDVERTPCRPFCFRSSITDLQCKRCDAMLHIREFILHVLLMILFTPLCIQGFFSPYYGRKSAIFPMANHIFFPEFLSKNSQFQR